MNFVQRGASFLNSNDSHFDGEVMWFGVLERFVSVWCYKSQGKADVSSLSDV